MSVSRISPDTPSTTFTIPVDFTFKGVVIGPVEGTSLPIWWNGGTASINWAFAFNPLAGTGTSGAFVINCPDLTYLPDQYFGWVIAGGVSYPVSLAAGKMTSTPTLTQSGRITVIGILGQQAIVNL